MQPQKVMPFIDKNGRVGYVGEAFAPVMMPLRRGVHFSIFTQKKGREEIHIGWLDHNKIRARQMRSADAAAVRDG